MLAEEQAALRRVATLVARGAPPAEVFGAVTAKEVGAVFSRDAAALGRYEPDARSTPVRKLALEQDGYVPVGAATRSVRAGVHRICSLDCEC